MSLIDDFQQFSPTWQHTVIAEAYLGEHRYDDGGSGSFQAWLATTQAGGEMHFEVCYRHPSGHSQHEVGDATSPDCYSYVSRLVTESLSDEERMASLLAPLIAAEHSLDIPGRPATRLRDRLLELAARGG